MSAFGNLVQYDIANYKYNRYELPPAYVAPGGAGAFAFSACAKCGSTSLFNAVYTGLYGKRFGLDGPGPPWVQNWEKWPSEGRPEGSLMVSAEALQNKAPTIPKIFFQVVRDPVERYISSFHSKVKCCWRNNTSSPERKICADDYADVPKVVQSIRRLADSDMPAGNPCLFFDEFATLMETIHSKGMQYDADLNQHVRAQTLLFEPGWVRWAGTVQDLGMAMHGLRNYGLHPINMKHFHGSGRANWNSTWAQRTETGHIPALETLCKLAQAEYAALSMPASLGPCRKLVALPVDTPRK
jgi:hypothetical protein